MRTRGSVWIYELRVKKVKKEVRCNKKKYQTRSRLFCFFAFRDSLLLFVSLVDSLPPLSCSTSSPSLSLSRSINGFPRRIRLAGTTHLHSPLKNRPAHVMSSCLLRLHLTTTLWYMLVLFNFILFLIWGYLIVLIHQIRRSFVSIAVVC